VRRQPFGGWKRSAIGLGAKAGGPNYVLTLGHWGAGTAARDLSDAGWLADSDPSGLRAESNVLRYRPLPQGVLLRADDDVTDAEVARAVTAARTAGTRLTVSSPHARPDIDARVDIVVESDEALATRLPTLAVDRVRVPGKVPDALRAAAHDAELYLDDAPLVTHPRIELLHYLREQAVSRTLHRYGNLPDGR
jgi:RHH-type proline utilization regulon transcriptional repressor/proline dehydrogenase/delta 1-pyrroline-5-carboxylate dehydrogenase